LFQAVGFYVQVADFIPSFGVLGFYSDLYVSVNDIEYFESLGRINGPFTTGISFALFLGMTSIVFYHEFRVRKSTVSLLILLLSLLTIYFTYTRSAVYGIIIVIIVYEVIHAGKKIVPAILLFTLIALAVEVGLNYVKESGSVESRLAVVNDGETNTKMTTNTAIAKYTLSNFPFFGFPLVEFEDHVDEAFSQQGTYLSYEAMYYYTNHNQPVFYLKHYGLIGLTLFSLLHLAIIIAVFKLPKTRRAVPLLLIFFNLQYSLLHNNFTIESPIFLAMLAGYLGRFTDDTT